MRLLLSMTSFGAALLAASFASAVPSSRLVYVRGEGAEACPQAIELRLAVLHRLGYNPFDPNAKSSILVQIRRDQERLRATVDLLDDQGLSRGSRYLDAPTNSCDELITAAALSISLAIDPERALAQPENPQSTERHIESESTSSDASGKHVTPAVTASPHPPAARTPTRRELVLSLHGASRALVEPNLGLDIGLGLRREHWSLSLEGRADLPVSSAVGADARLTTWLFMGVLAPCLRAAPLRFCGLLGYGLLGASSTGVQHPKDDKASYAAFGLRLGTEHRVSRRLRLGVHVDALASLSTYRAELGNSVVWESNRLSGLFGLDVAWDIE